MLLGAGPIGLLILQVLKIAGADEVHVIEPCEHRRGAALELGAKEVFATVEDFVNETGKGGRPLVIEATNSPFGFRDAVRAAKPTRFPPRRRAGAVSRSSSCGEWATTLPAPSTS